MDQRTQLQLVLCEDRDRGSGKCRINYKLLSSIGYHFMIGDYLKLECRDFDLLCSAWPTQNLEKKIYVDPFIICQRTSQYKDDACTSMQIDKKLPAECLKVTHLKYERAKFIEVDVVIDNRQTPNDHFDLQCLVYYMLLDQVVNVDAVVNCHRRLRSKWKFEYLIIKNVQSLSEFAIVDNSTKIRISSITKLPKKQKMIQIGGLDEILSTLKDIANTNFQYHSLFSRLGLPCTKAVMLQGPSGVGKTQLVQKLAQDLDVVLVVINSAEIFASYEGESEEGLKKYFDQARKIAKKDRCILFIDEIDALCPSRDDEANSEEQLVVSCLVTLLEEIRAEKLLFVIGATNASHAVSSCLYGPSRFENQLYIAVPNMNQRESILKLHTSSMLLAADVNMKEISEMCCGYVGADLQLLCREAVFIAVDRISKADIVTVYNNIELNMNDFVNAIHRVTPSSRRGALGTVELSPISWEDIGGLKKAIEWPLKFPVAFTRLGLSRPRGVLLFGPPGCSKTTLVRAAATNCHASFLSLSGAQLYSPYLGDSERAIRQAFAQARMSTPCILFLDEIDAIVSRRVQNSKNSVQMRILSTLLNEMDGVSSAQLSYDSVLTKPAVAAETMQMLCDDRVKDTKWSEMNNEATERDAYDDVIVVCATNRPDIIDDALLRPGRIDRIIYVPPPDREERLEILRVHTRKMPLHDTVDLESIADSTKLCSGADLQNICREAAMEAMRKSGVTVKQVKQEDFDGALRNISGSLTLEQQTVYKKFLQCRLHMTDSSL